MFIAVSNPGISSDAGLFYLEINAMSIARCRFDARVVIEEWQQHDGRVRPRFSLNSE
jgi:hypothetical protein